MTYGVHDFSLENLGHITYRVNAKVVNNSF